MRELVCAEKSDLFDVLASVAYARSPITREERVVENKDLIFSHYDDKQQAFLDFVLSLDNGGISSAPKATCLTPRAFLIY